MVLLSDPACWSHVTPAPQLAHYIVLTTLRSAAVIWQLVTAPLKRAPFNVLLNAMNDPETLRGLHDVPPCLRDPFLESLLAHFTTADDAASLECQSVIQGLLSLTAANTYSVERLHSRNLRFTKSRPQTHQPKLPLVAIRHQAFAGLGWTSKLGSGCRVKQKTPQTQRSTSHKPTPKGGAQLRVRRGSCQTRDAKEEKAWPQARWWRSMASLHQ